MTTTTLTLAPAGAPPLPQRRLALRWALGVVAVLVAAAAVCEAAGWPFLAGPLQRLLSQRLDRPVTIDGGFSLHLLGSPRLTAGRFRIDDSTGAAGRPLLEATRPTLQARWPDLLHAGGGRPLHLQAVTADRLTLNLRRQIDGRANWQLRRATDTEGSSGIDGARVQQLVVPRADVALDDAVRQLQVQLAVQGPSPGVQGDWTARAEGRFRGQPLTMQARASRNLAAVALGERGHYIALNAAARVGRADLSFDGSVLDPRGRQLWDGALRVSGPSLAAVGEPLGLTLPSTGAFSLMGRLRQQGTLWSLDMHQAKVGRSQLAGELTYSSADPARGRLTGTITGPALWLQDLGPAVGTDTTTPRAQGRVLPQRSLDLPSLGAMDADVQFRLQRLALGAPGVADLSPLKASLRLHDRVLTLAELDAGSALGRLTGQARIDARTQPATWDTDLLLSGLDLAHAWPRNGDAVPTPPVTGRLDARLQLQGSGSSVAQVLAGSHGRLLALLREGRASHLAVELAGLDLAQALGLTLRGNDALQVSCAAVDVPVTGGRARPLALVMDTRDSTVWTEGELSLHDERLQLVAQVVPKDISPLALRSPIRVDGTLAAPAWHVERGALARRVVPALALGALHPLLALLPLVDKAGGAESAQAKVRVEACERLARQGLGSRPAGPV